MSEFNPSHPIDYHLIIPFADKYLYKIGLSLTKHDSNVKRKWIFNPILIFFTSSLFITFKIITLFVNEENEYIFIILGDFGYLLNISIDCNLMFILSTTLIFGSQILYYYNHKNGIKPTFLKVFQMMAGLVTPLSIGLTNQTEIISFVKRFNQLLKFMKINTNLISIISLTPLLITYAIKTSLINTILFGLPNAILMSIYCTHFGHFIIYQIIYFYGLCYYLKQKLNENYSQRTCRT